MVSAIYIAVNFIILNNVCLYGYLALIVNTGLVVQINRGFIIFTLFSTFTW